MNLKRLLDKRGEVSNAAGQCSGMCKATGGFHLGMPAKSGHPATASC